MPEEQPTIDDPAIQERPAVAYEPAGEEDEWLDESDEPDELPPRPRRRLLKPVPLAGRDRRLVNIFSSPGVEPEPAAKSSPQKSSPQKSSPPMARPVSDAAAMLPRALRRLAGGDFVDMPWRNRGSGIKEVVLPDDGCAAVRFVSVAPGVRLPIAREDAAAALLLAGAASDRAGYYERGDIVFADADGGPTAEGEGDCVAFIVAEAPAKSPGRLSRVLHLVMGA